MWQAPVFQALHAMLRGNTAQHGNNLHKIAAYVRSCVAVRPREQASFPPKRPFGWTAPQVVGNAM